MDNYDKQETYAHLKTKLKKAINSSFYFEAVMIEYAIIEDRTSSILDHGKVCDDAFSTNKKLGNKLNSIEHQIGKKHPVISKKVNPELIAMIKVWKDKRNDYVHRAASMKYDDERLKEIAEEGNELVRRLINDSRKVTTYYKNHQE